MSKSGLPTLSQSKKVGKLFNNDLRGVQSVELADSTVEEQSSKAQRTSAKDQHKGPAQRTSTATNQASCTTEVHTFARDELKHSEGTAEHVHHTHCSPVSSSLPARHCSAVFKARQLLPVSWMKSRSGSNAGNPAAADAAPRLTNATATNIGLIMVHGIPVLYNTAEVLRSSLGVGLSGGRK